jgi:nitrite reductase/ring-hydroxylating ferredoxin subunit
MADYVYAIESNRILPGRSMRVQIGEKRLVICNHGGQFYAADESCPHQGASLAGGKVEQGCVICPLHHWPWDLKTGLTDPKLPHFHLIRYPCKVADGKIYVDISRPIPPKICFDADNSESKD